MHHFVGSLNCNVHLLNVYYISITYSTVSEKSEGETIVVITDTF